MTPALPDHLRRDTTFGFLDKSAESDRLFNPVLVSNTDTNTMYKAILDELRRSTSFIFSVAFVSADAIASLKQALIDFDGQGKIITSTYLGFNSPETFRELENLTDLGIETHVFDNDSQGFHPKGFIFNQEFSTTAIIGSSNLTSRALKSNHEWNLRFSALPDGDIVDQLHRAIGSQLRASVPLTREWIQAYEDQYVAPEDRKTIHVSTGSLADANEIIRPNAMQEEALEEIAKVRTAGEKKALVVSATGTGKTILAALDVKAAKPERTLFVVHREQILDRAIEEFTKVLDLSPDDIGKYVGSHKEIDRKFVFATVQSLGSIAKLQNFDRNHFDYILIDEVHRAGAQMHRNIIEYFQPSFMLGITATPERTDDFNVYSLFDFNVPYEIRLQKALDEDMLAPFHYYGIADFELNGQLISDASILRDLVSEERVAHLVDAIEIYGHAGAAVKGLIFCSRKEEATELSRLLNEREVHGKQLRTRALTGDDPVAMRESVVNQLEAGHLDYILTVDVFNEGIDIRSVNQVIMLRQTKSSIVFTQQLGRGLRKSDGKSHLIVIDFIGNYANNYMVPIALFGDSSLNKESLRKNMIDAQEAGVVAGLSSVNFDPIAKERIFESIASTKLDGVKNLKAAFRDIRSRLGTTPRLIDFARFDVVDPVVLAGARGNYWSLLLAFKAVEVGPSEVQSKALTFISAEFLNGKRPHELLVLESLIRDRSPMSTGACADLLRGAGVDAEPLTLKSLERIFNMDFFTTPERAKYGAPIVDWTDSEISLAPWFNELLDSSHEFSAQVDDLVETGLFLARHRYRWNESLELGKMYSRKEICRLLNWRKNEQATMFGYKVDAHTGTCPIFVKSRKSDDISASIAYGDAFINESTLRWFSRSRKTLQSPDVVSILSNKFELYVFGKRDDREGTDLYYLGRAKSSNPEQTTMPGDEPGSALNVVTMNLDMESPVESALYDYLTLDTSI
ncbi:DEAD/DEAH box helicase [Brevibacterium celere]|uniref:DEAD/DEAH box helicase n=3 Tax=Actinomycetes TaxID=1760 RepID=UPI0031D42441